MCEKCSLGWFNSSLQGTGGYNYVEKCSKCDIGCDICDNPKTCITCTKKYDLQSDKTCKKDSSDFYSTLIGLAFIVIILLIILFVVRFGFLGKDTWNKIKTIGGDISRFTKKFSREHSGREMTPKNGDLTSPAQKTDVKDQIIKSMDNLASADGVHPAGSWGKQKSKSEVFNEDDENDKQSNLSKDDVVKTPKYNPYSLKPIPKDSSRFLNVRDKQDVRLPSTGNISDAHKRLEERMCEASDSEMSDNQLKVPSLDEPNPISDSVNSMVISFKNRGIPSLGRINKNSIKWIGRSHQKDGN